LHAPIAIVPLAIEMLVLITALAPAIYKGRFRSKPNLGLVVWFGTFAFGMLTAISALLVTIWSLVELLEESIRGKLLMTEILSQIGLWLVLGLGGVALALVNQRTENYFLTAKRTSPQLGLAGSPMGSFEGVPLLKVDLPIILAFAAPTKPHVGIYVSSGALQSFTEEEMSATLWHEWSHIKMRHFAIKAIGRFVLALTPRLRASKLLQTETDELMELACDQVAVRKVSEEALLSARAKASE
jgi:Zn-dependent protease with chaperone function